MSYCRTTTSFFIISLLLACSQRAPSPIVADQVFLNGDVVTVDAARAATEAVAVKDGKIIALGSSNEIAALIGPATEEVDLAGKTLLPGFIDAHSHFSQAVTLINWVNVSPPPVGPVESIDDLVETLKAAVAEKALEPGEPLYAYGYDENALAEGRHMTRLDLDPHFPDRPVFVMHISGHGAVLNGKALAWAGITSETPTPEGGVIVRLPGGTEPAGLLMETAWMAVAFELWSQPPEDFAASLRHAQKHYAANGYTTIQDGASGYEPVKGFQQAAQQGIFFLDVVALPVFTDLDKFLQDDSLQFGTYQDRLKLGGIKILADGSPQGKTAYFTEPLLTGGPGGEADWRGEPIMPYEDYEAIFMRIHKQGWRSYTHANGDAAIDMVLEAHRKANIKPEDDLRNVVIHSQFVRPDQLDAYKAFGISPSFFSNHAFFWGDVHTENLGQARADFLSPLSTAAAKGIIYTNHTDYIVTPLDPMFLVWTAVNRVSRSGRVIGAGERVSPLRAIEAMTLDAAWQNREEDSKGSIEVGKLADLVVLSANPLTVEPMAIRDIQVLATYKEGQKVY